MGFQIKEPVDAVPVVRTSRAPIWDAVHEADGQWVPVELETKAQANKLASLARTRNAGKGFGCYESKQRRNVCFIRFVKHNEAAA